MMARAFSNSAAARFSVALMLCAALWAGNARAAEPSAADKAASEALFDDARRLMQSGAYKDACAKFAESQRLDAGVGTLLYLADCYEKDGRLASSWATFREAAAAARAAGQGEREKIARDRAAQLEPKLTKLEIEVPAASRVQGLEIRRDDTVVGPPLWGSPVPVDAGSHTIVASAPGKQTWSQQIDVSDASAPVRVEIPSLADQPIREKREAQTTHGSLPQRERAEPGTSGQTQRLVGYVVAGAGVAAIGVGAYFWLRGSSKHDDALEHCTPDCDASARSLQDDATRANTIGNVSAIAGGALIIGGVVLVLTAPSAKSEARLGVRAVDASGSLAPALRFEGVW